LFQGLSAPLIAALLGVGLCWGLAAQTQQSSAVHASSSTPGRKEFLSTCSGCHGLDGKGGDRAPGIASGSDAAKLSEAELKRIVTQGIPGAGMPSFSFLGQPELTSILGYLRVLQGKGSNSKMPGDPHKGASLFVGTARCSECHMAAGAGGFIASDLSAYGNGRTPAEIRQAITAPNRDPDHHVKKATAVTRDGKTYEGVVRTEDNFSLVLQAQDGAFVSLQKADIARMSYDPASLMPQDYGSTLSARELDDLVSYLMSLQSKTDVAAGKKTTKRHWEDGN